MDFGCEPYLARAGIAPARPKEWNIALIYAFSSINKLAVLVAGVVHVVISHAWFQPVFFSKVWVKLCGRDLKPAVRWIPIGLAAHMVPVLALALTEECTSRT